MSRWGGDCDASAVAGGKFGKKSSFHLNPASRLIDTDGMEHVLRGCCGTSRENKGAITQFDFSNQFSHSTARPFKATLAHTLSVHSEKALAVWASSCELPGVSLSCAVGNLSNSTKNWFRRRPNDAALARIAAAADGCERWASPDAACAARERTWLRSS